MPLSRTSRALVGAAAIALLTLLAYIPALRAGYAWDDPDHVPQAPFQRTGTFLKWIWFKPGATPQYYPLTHTTFWIESHIWGMNPAGYHAVNVLLQIANSLLLWAVLRRLNVAAAWLAAAIFAVHPINVESVAWITERKNTLSAFFYFLSFLLAMRVWKIDREPSGPQHASAAGTINWPAYALCLTCFVAAVLSKTVTSTLPAALVLVLWWKHRRLDRRDVLMLLPFLAVALGVALLTSGMEQWNVGAYGSEFMLSFAERCLIAGRALWFYTAKLFWPARLAFIYPRWNVDPAELWQWTFPAAVIIAITVLWLLRGRLGRGPLVAALFFIVTLFPALGFINVYPMRFSFVADHFQYLAGIGLIVVAVQLFWRLPGPQAVRCLATTALLACLTFLTCRQARAYKDEPTLWRDTLAKNPACWLAMDNLGVDAANRGDDHAALTWYDRSLAVYPAQPEAHLLRGQLFMSEGQAEDAEREFAAAVAVAPGDTRTAVRAGQAVARLLAARGRLEEAAQKYQQVLAIEPRLEPARLEYALLLRRLNRPDQAIDQYQKAIEQNPDSVAARSALSEMLFQAGYLNDAMQIIAQAIDIEPGPTLRNNYGVMLLKARRPAEAAQQFSSAIAARPDFAEAYDGLGSALEAQGNVAAAIAMYQKALSLKPDFPAARDHLAHVRRPPS